VDDLLNGAEVLISMTWGGAAVGVDSLSFFASSSRCVVNWLSVAWKRSSVTTVSAAT
jgi:hypothetical protein